MVVRILGSGAGGGVPQWNCGCRQCAAARTGLILKRTQCCVAASVDGQRWFLINASPDLRSQLLSLQCQPVAQARRTPFEALLLTDADLDHTLGLFLLRESDSPITIYSSKAIREALDQGLRLTEVLHRYCGVRWIEAPFDFAPIMSCDGSESGLEYKAVEIEGPGPRFRPSRESSCRIFYVLRDLATYKSILIAPAVTELDRPLLVELNLADAILFDGTLWSKTDFEISGLASRSLPALSESHLPILGGSMETMAKLPARKKVYLHINNTNPILWDNGRERRQLDKLGIEVAWDGMEFEV